MSKLYQYVLISIEITHYNGFTFRLLYINTNKTDSSLFGINFSKRFFYLDLFYKTIKVFDNTSDLDDMYQD